MNKDVHVAFIGLNKTKSAHPVEPLHYTIVHMQSVLNWMPGSGGAQVTIIQANIFPNYTKSSKLIWVNQNILDNISPLATSNTLT